MYQKDDSLDSFFSDSINRPLRLPSPRLPRNYEALQGIVRPYINVTSISFGCVKLDIVYILFSVAATSFGCAKRNILMLQRGANQSWLSHASYSRRDCNRSWLHHVLFIALPFSQFVILIHTPPTPCIKALQIRLYEVS